MKVFFKIMLLLNLFAVLWGYSEGNTNSILMNGICAIILAMYDINE